MKVMKLPKEQRDQVIQLIQQYFKEEHGEDLGELAADGVMHFFMSQLAPFVYNQALDDCRQLVNRQMGSLEDDIYALEQRVKLSR